MSANELIMPTSPAQLLEVIKHAMPDDDGIYRVTPESWEVIIGVITRAANNDTVKLYTAILHTIAKFCPGPDGAGFNLSVPKEAFFDIFDKQSHGVRARYDVEAERISISIPNEIKEIKPDART